MLVDTEPLYFEATCECIRPLGVELDKAEYLKDMAAGRSAWERARERGATEEEIRQGKAARNARYQQLIRARNIQIPGVRQALEELSRRYAMAIVTTSKRADFELIHREGHIVRHMQFVLVSGDYARPKPAPDPYLTALDRFGAAPHEALVVEDSERGLRSAVAAGIDCVVVANEFVNGQDLSAATHSIDSVAQLPRLLARL